MEAMWLMLQQKIPNDYVIATGKTHSVQEFVERAFSAVDLDWRNYVKTDQKFLRPAEVDLLRGDASLAKLELGWEPKTDFDALVQMMVDADMKTLK